MPHTSRAILRRIAEPQESQITDPCRVLGGHRKVKKQGRGVASSSLFHPLQKPRLSERKTYRELELMINPPKEVRQVKFGGKFKLYVEK